MTEPDRQSPTIQRPTVRGPEHRTRTAALIDGERPSHPRLTTRGATQRRDEIAALGAAGDVCVADPPVVVTGWRVRALGDAPPYGVRLFTG